MQEQTTSQCLVLEQGTYQYRLGYSFEEQYKDSIYSDPLARLDSQGSFQNILKSNQDSSLFKHESLKFKSFQHSEELVKEIMSKRNPEEIANRPIMTNHNWDCSWMEKELKTQLFFETIGSPYFQSANSQLLQLYASGKTTGVVINMGHEKNSIVSIIDGQLLQYSYQQSIFAGKQINKEIQRLFNVGYLQAIQIKHSLLGIDYNQIQTEQQQDQIQMFQQNYTLPDGWVITKEDLKSIQADQFFKMSNTQITIPQMLMSLVQRLDSEQLEAIWPTLLIGGGGSSMLGVNEEISKSVHLIQELSSKTKIHFLQERYSSTYLGAAILASLGVFQPFWISKAEYDEYGPSIINRKCI